MAHILPDIDDLPQYLYLLKTEPELFRPASTDNANNTVIGHEQIFHDDGTNVGYSDVGIIRNENISDYGQCTSLGAEKSEIEKNIERVRDEFGAEDYKVTPRVFGGNNCQDFVDAVR